MKKKIRCLDCGLFKSMCVCSNLQKRLRAFIENAKSYGFTETQARFLYNEFDDVKEI